MLVEILATVVTLAVLIIIHEYGHYRVAVACGIKVLRFSFGFGPVLKSWQRGETEFVLSAIPVGGYVRMVDEREGQVPEADRPRAFNRQPLRSRVAVVAAGPLANLLLAVVLYTIVFVVGTQDAKPVIAQPTPGSPAALAGLKAGDWIQAASLDDTAQTSDWPAVASFDDLDWNVRQASVDDHRLRLLVVGLAGGPQHVVAIDLRSLKGVPVDQDFTHRVGFRGVYSEAVINTLVPGGPAQRAGVAVGDRVLRVDGQAVADNADLRDRIMASQKGDAAQTMHWTVLRNGHELVLTVTPELVDDRGTRVAKVQAGLGGAIQLVDVRYGPWQALTHAVRRTYDICAIDLKMLGRMVIGQASVKNLNSILSVADVAGQAASMGLDVFLGFLAAISAMLGVFNLLPLPVLDGGHLMYYLFEGVTGRAVSGVWLERLQRGGVALLLLVMSLALYNDIVRKMGEH